MGNVIERLGSDNSFSLKTIGTPENCPPCTHEQTEIKRIDRVPATFKTKIERKQTTIIGTAH